MQQTNNSQSTNGLFITLAYSQGMVINENQEQKSITTGKDLMKEIFQYSSCKQGTLYKYKVNATIEINNAAMSNKLHFSDLRTPDLA